MDKASYPRPVCSRCGMPMTLRTDSDKWFCGTCMEFTEPREPPRLAQPATDPSKPKGRWIKFAIVAAIIFILMLLRQYLI